MSLQEKLRRLYNLDRQVRGLQARLDAATSRLDQHQTHHQQINQQQQELADQVKHVQVTANTLEKQAQDIDQRVARLREQMGTVTSNKEYSALLIEVSTLKNDKSKLEDEALEHMSRADELKRDLAELHERIAQQQKMVNASELEVTACQDEVGERLESLTAQRDQAARDVPPEACAVFERLAADYDGDAMAQITEENRKAMEYTCGGCFMNLPVEMVNTLMMRPDALVRCTSCGRILYLDEQIKASFAR
ncbi:MAG: C4-type zinc ribbon domain-containing protein [Phycisphaeraceae bacterium]